MLLAPVKFVWAVEGKFCQMFPKPTSSSAHGGGGSFRDQSYRKGALLWCVDGRGNPTMDRKVVGMVFFGVFAAVTSPQLLDVVWHLTFRMYSEPGVLCTCWTQNVFHATTACTFWTSELLKGAEPDMFLAFWLGNVLRTTAVHTFFHISTSKNVPRQRCF